jgi:protein TonB
MFSGLDTAQSLPARRWTAAVSFTLQAALVAAALALPFLNPQNLPDAFARRQIFVPASSGVERAPVTQNTSGTIPSRAPVFPILVRTGPAVHVEHPGTEIGIVGPPEISIGSPNNGLEHLISTPNSRPIPQPPPVATHHPPVSLIMEGNLIRRIEPRYPVIAQEAGIQGTVVVKALISRNGTIEGVQVLSGQPMLAAAALAAVREWKYRPYQLNGQPVEVETEITVNFVLRR